MASAREHEALVPPSDRWSVPASCKAKEGNTSDTTALMVRSKDLLALARKNMLQSQDLVETARQLMCRQHGEHVEQLEHIESDADLIAP